MAIIKRAYRLFVAVVFVVMIAATPPQITFAQQPTETLVHIVAWGETMSFIAFKYGVTVEAIMQANHLAQADTIYAGQQLVIPAGRSGNDGISQRGDQAQHTVQPGETLYRIGLAYDVSIQALMTANALSDADHLYAGQVLIIPQESNDLDISPPAENLGGEYIVQPGDTLSGISERYGISIFALQTANSLINPSQIFAGQTLIVPGAANALSSGYTPEQTIVTHIVQPGETLLVIAAHFGISMWVIAQNNNISNVSLIYPGQLLSIPASDALTSPQTLSITTGQSIVVDVSEQRTYAYENGVIQQSFTVSTGLPGQDTQRGTFEIQNKIPVAYAATWDIQMPYWLGFYWSGSLQNGFHALPILSNGLRLWEGLLGSPASYGCVILSESDAQWLYEWANIGTPVTVQN